ncbi:hypothetical protein B0H19DRAFT_937852 [Mycena capillaripes]|nr:hypothetical protein B0H19DRAFT_937852 [Mycena capillaripes]
MHEAVKSALRFTTAPAWADYVISAVGINSASTDAEIEEYICDNTISLSHAAETASMSPKGTTWASSILGVKGLSGIRIVDLSVAVRHEKILSFIPSAHPQAATYIIAVRATDITRKTNK